MNTAATGVERRSSEELRRALEELRADVLREGDELFDDWRARIKRAEYLPSARNLAHYIVLRRHELRELQLDLMPWGLSSLGRCEARVLENLDAVIAALERFDPERSAGLAGEPAPVDFFQGHVHLRENTEAALGPTPRQREVRIMVTLPGDAAVDYEFVRRLVERGTDIVRINCAHDDAEAWRAMAAHVERAGAELGRRCRICMDLTGPRARTGDVSAPRRVRLHPGDRVLMTPSAPPARGEVPAFECSFPGVFERLEPGHSVCVDEGSLGMVVEEERGEGVLLRVTDSRPKGSRLRPEKGINFPDTELRSTPLTPKDLEDLDVIAELADAVGYSFVQRPEDIALLQDELARRLDTPEAITLVAKIETELAIRKLPELIVQAAGAQPLAVMIARGDLAVEVGYRRMAELQEEILWLCEAAHVPVIWATQVLDRFVRKGVGARAEITDAAMAERAECVMLNKGPFVVDAVELLTDMLSSMEGHQFKKVSRMRALHSW